MLDRIVSNRRAGIGIIILLISMISSLNCQGSALGISTQGAMMPAKKVLTISEEQSPARYQPQPVYAAPEAVSALATHQILPPEASYIWQPGKITPML